MNLLAQKQISDFRPVADQSVAPHPLPSSGVISVAVLVARKSPCHPRNGLFLTARFVEIHGNMVYFYLKRQSVDGCKIIDMGVLSWRKYRSADDDARPLQLATTSIH